MFSFLKDIGSKVGDILSPVATNASTSPTTADPMAAKPQLGYMWEVQVSDRLGNGETMGFYAKTTAVPAAITEPIKGYICGSEYNYAGRDISPRILRITFFDNELLQVSGFFDYWRLLANEGKTKRSILPKYYYRDVILSIHSSNDDKSISYVFKDCFPLEVGELALSYSDSGEATFDVLIAFHDREMVGGRWWKPVFTPRINGKVIL